MSELEQQYADLGRSLGGWPERSDDAHYDELVALKEFLDKWLDWCSSHDVPPSAVSIPPTGSRHSCDWCGTTFSDCRQAQDEGLKCCPDCFHQHSSSIAKSPVVEQPLAEDPLDDPLLDAVWEWHVRRRNWSTTDGYFDGLEMLRRTIERLSPPVVEQPEPADEPDQEHEILVEMRLAVAGPTPDPFVGEGFGWQKVIAPASEHPGVRLIQAKIVKPHPAVSIPPTGSTKEAFIRALEESGASEVVMDAARKAVNDPVLILEQPEPAATEPDEPEWFEHRCDCKRTFEIGPKFALAAPVLPPLPDGTGSWVSLADVLRQVNLWENHWGIGERGIDDLCKRLAAAAVTHPHPTGDEETT